MALNVLRGECKRERRAGEAMTRSFWFSGLGSAADRLPRYRWSTVKAAYLNVNV